MRTWSRRSFIATASLIPFAAWFERYGVAVAANLVRYSATSVKGQTMLKAYAKAVCTMQTAPEASPLGWLFQWYTHAVRPDRTKAAEINRLYPSPGPQKTLAQDMWSTCQAHFNPVNEDFFLPWHRMYVYFLERIVRKVSGVTTFTLPYWNYSVSGAAHGVIPNQFRLPNDPSFKCLFTKKRNAPSATNPNRPDVNGGEPIDKSDPGALDLTALGECVYSRTATVSGFCLALDFGLHGNVHVDTGDPQNMGSVPWAANDPIFWLHHGNIDRLWASWNRAGRKNPTSAAFLNQQFVFADENGNRVATTVKDFLKTAPLGYSYDRYEPVPPCPISPGALQPPPVTLLRKPPAPVELGPDPVRIPLTVPPGTASPGLMAALTAPPTARRLYLVLKHLQANLDPAVLYHVYMDLPEGTPPSAGAYHKAGIVNFFNAVAHGEHEAAAAAPDDRFYSFDVTDVVARLKSRGALRDQPVVTIAPSDRPEAEAKPVVGDIELVQQ